MRSPHEQLDFAPASQCAHVGAGGSPVLPFRGFKAVARLRLRHHREPPVVRERRKVSRMWQCAAAAEAERALGAAVSPRGRADPARHSTLHAAAAQLIAQLMD